MLICPYRSNENEFSLITDCFFLLKSTQNLFSSAVNPYINVNKAFKILYLTFLLRFLFFLSDKGHTKAAKNVLFIFGPNTKQMHILTNLGYIPLKAKLTRSLCSVDLFQKKKTFHFVMVQA